MKVSLQWIREFVPLSQSVAEISDLLTFAGVEVEGIETTGVAIDKVVVAQILASEQHPNADRLSVCRVDDGSGLPRQIVCGAKNYLVGDKVPLALPGAVLPGDFKIKVGKLRGVDSEGMLCSAKELGISEESAGLLILPPDSVPGTLIGELFPADTVFDLEITPNRPDLISHRGIARELAAITGQKWHDLSIFPVSAMAEVPPVRLESPEACSWYSARVVRGVKVGASPDWLRKKLESVGLRSINNVVDVTNLVMLELGEPLHAFDLAKVDRGIVVRHAHGEEKFLALDGREYSLLPDDLVIADESRALAIAGVMGGQESGVTATTTDIILESAWFSPTGIRRTSRRLGLMSDASYRFERGVDPGILEKASARACQLLEEVAGGRAEESLSIAGELPPLSWKVTLRHDRCRSLLGQDLPDARIDEILSGLGLESPGTGEWRIPSFRADITREVDLIEEVGRVEGMDGIPSRIQSFAAPISDVDRLYDYQLRTKQHLVALGFFEARTLSLRPETNAIENAWRTNAALRVRNPLTEDQTFFRESLIPGLLAVADTNQRMGANSIRLLEVGRIFRSGAQEEIQTLGLLITGDARSADWRSPVEALTFFDLKETISRLVVVPLEFRKSTHPSLILSAEIFCGNVQLGWIGQLSPEIVRNTGLKAPVFVAELDLVGMQFLTVTLPKFQPLDRFPAVTRDVALLAPEGLSHAEIEGALLSARETLLREVALFDIFSDPTGERVPAGKKSLAYSLTYRSADRTLTQDEVNAAHARLKTLLVEKCGVSLRE